MSLDTTYNSRFGQSLYDICLQTYGTIEEIFKIISDNNIGSLNDLYLYRNSIKFDSSLIVNYDVYDHLNNNNIYYISDNIVPKVVPILTQDKQFEDGNYFEFQDLIQFDFN